MSDLNEIFEKAKREELEKLADLERLDKEETPIVTSLNTTDLLKYYSRRYSNGGFYEI